MNRSRAFGPIFNSVGRAGDKILLEGEADQVPDQEPGDIVFNLTEVEHETFKRAGADLSASMRITLAEALCGFSRVVIKHLDGRGIYINHRQSDIQVLKPGQVVKVAGEGMPYKKSDSRGDLYLVADVKFPDGDLLLDENKISRLQELLPGPSEPIVADTVDEVNYDETADLEDFGAGDGAHAGGAWEDEEEEDEGQPQCAQQ